MVHDFPQSDERKTAFDVLLWLAVAHPQTGPTSPHLARYIYEYRVLEKIHRTQLDGEAWAEYDAAKDQINNNHIEFVVQAISEADKLSREYQARLAARRAISTQSEADNNGLLCSKRTKPAAAISTTATASFIHSPSTSKHRADTVKTPASYSGQTLQHA